MDPAMAGRATLGLDLAALGDRGDASGFEEWLRDQREPVLGATSTVLSLRLQVLVWSLVALTGYRAWGMSQGGLRSLGRWWVGSGRWSIGQLW